MTDPNQPRYPDIVVQLAGEDGNAFAILGRVRRAMLKGGASPSHVKAMMDEATSGNYDHLLVTVQRWVSVE